MTKLVEKAFRHTLNSLAYHTNGSFSKPGLIYLKLTERCNFHCEHCDIWRSGSNQDLLVKDWKKIFQNLKTLVKNPTITISGGEPLLYPGFWKLVGACKYVGINISLNTNGSLINDTLAERLIQPPFAKVEISLYTLRPEIQNKLRNTPLAFERASRALTALTEAKKNFPTSKTNLLVAFLLTKINAEEVEEFIKHFSKQGIWTTIQSLDTNVQVLNQGEVFQEEKELATNDLWITDKKLVNETFDKLLALKKSGFLVHNRLPQLNLMRSYYLEDWEKIKKLSCRAGHNNLIISKNGDAFFCFKGPRIGNLLNKDAKTIWCSPQAKKTRQKNKDCQRLCKIMNCNYSGGLLTKFTEYIKKPGA